MNKWAQIPAMRHESRVRSGNQRKCSLPVVPSQGLHLRIWSRPHELAVQTFLVERKPKPMSTLYSIQSLSPLKGLVFFPFNSFLSSLSMYKFVENWQSQTKSLPQTHSWRLSLISSLHPCDSSEEGKAP